MDLRTSGVGQMRISPFLEGGVATLATGHTSIPGLRRDSPVPSGASGGRSGVGGFPDADAEETASVSNEANRSHLGHHTHPDTNEIVARMSVEVIPP